MHRPRRSYEYRRYVPALFVLLVVILLAAAAITTFTLTPGSEDEWSAAELAALADSVLVERRARTPSLLSNAESERAGGLSIDILSQPEGATVLLDYDSIGVTPIRQHWLPEGVYVLSLGGERIERVDTVLIIEAGADRVFAFSGASTSGSGRADDAGADGARTAAASRAAVDPDQDAGIQRESPVPSQGDAQPVLAEDETNGGSDEVAAGHLYLTSEPPGASVEVDGEVRGVTPVEIREISPGAHEVAIGLDGYEEERAVLDVVSAETVRRSFELAALEGVLVVLAKPWGSIYIDGQLRARDLDVRLTTPLSAGTHRVAAVHPVLGTREATVQIQPNRTHEVVIDLSEASSDAEP